LFLLSLLQQAIQHNMGCNESKQEDIKKDNEQRARTQVQPINSTTATPTKAIASSVTNNEAMLLGTSFSDTREVEQGYFKDIVDRTAHNFIDVSVTPSQVSEKKYRDFRGQVMDNKALSGYTFDRIPVTSQAYNISVLTQPTPNKISIDFADKWSQSMTSVFKGLKVKDVGELVISFPEIADAPPRDVHNSSSYEDDD